MFAHGHAWMDVCNNQVRFADLKPKIYISHPPLSVEDTARMVGVSKRRLKELVAIIENPNGSEPRHSAAVKHLVPRHPRRTGNG
jgi:hypothetical protein